MLENLNDIDWASYNRGVDIPQLFHDLASSVPAKYKNAYSIIEDRVLVLRLLMAGHMDYVDKVLGTDLTVNLTRFLLELLTAPDIKSHLLIVSLLEGIVSLRETPSLEFSECHTTHMNEVISLICQNIDTLGKILENTSEIRGQVNIIYLIATCILEDCTERNKDQYIEKLINLLNTTHEPTVLTLLIESLFTVFSETTYPVALCKIYVEQLRKIQSESSDKVILNLINKILNNLNQ